MHCIRALAVFAVVLGSNLGVAADKLPPMGAQKSATFTDAQVTAGLSVYTANCINCHGARLDDGPGSPPLKGPAFRAHWEHQSADALYTFIHTKMPPENPHGLEASAYVDVMAFILKSNGVQSGTAPMSSDPATLASLQLAAVLPPAPAQNALLNNKPPNYIPADASPDQITGVHDEISLDAQKKIAERMANLSPVTWEMLSEPPAGEWLNWRRTYDANGFSPLAQVNRKNASKLKLASVTSLPPGQNEVAPIEHEGVIFLADNGRVLALDAVTGDQLWQYKRSGAGGLVRAIGIFGDRIFVPMGSDVVALNFRTGAEVWSHTFSSVDGAIQFPGGPVIAKGKVLIGARGGGGAGPFVAALDTETGNEAWRFYVIARPGQAGGDSWAGHPLEQLSGGNIWISGSYDPALDLYYVGTGQTYDIDLLLTGNTAAPGSNDGLYTDSTLAFRPETGELVWYYQHQNREVWDLDWAFERTLATLNVQGKPRRTVTTAGKVAIFDTLDAATGEYLFSSDAGLQDLIDRIDPKTGVKHIALQHEPKPDVQDFICTSPVGGRNWPTSAYNPQTGILYAALAETCSPYLWRPGAGVRSFERPPVHPKSSDGMVGRVQAFELATGRKIWMQRRRAQQSSAILATNGGLIFEGSRDRWFRASDDRSGKVLWQMRLDNSPSSFPISYSVDGVQYIAVVTGSGNPQEMYLGRLTPEIPLPPGSTTLWTFRVQDPKK